MDMLLRLIAVSDNPLVQQLPQKLWLEVFQIRPAAFAVSNTVYTLY